MCACCCQDVSEEGFPVRCLPIGRSPSMAVSAAAAASEESDAAETSRGAFSVLSRQVWTSGPNQGTPLKRRLSDALLAAQGPDPKCAKLGLWW